MRQASYIMTYRDGGDPARRRNLDAVLAWLAGFPELEITLVEQDDAPRLEGPLPHPDVRTTFTYNPGPFNKSWGFNVGFRLSTAAWLAFGDADLIVGDALRSALSYLASGYHAVKPYRRLLDLTDEESEHIRAGRFDWIPARAPADAPNREGVGERIVYAGGLVLLARTAFTAMGGWDERFRGWGGEDDAMSYKLERARVPAIELDARPAVHLHHERPAERTHRQPHYASNRALLEQYTRYSDAQLARLAEVQMQLIGRGEKYRPG
jgi:hypothetical protein